MFLGLTNRGVSRLDRGRRGVGGGRGDLRGREGGWDFRGSIGGRSGRMRYIVTRLNELGLMRRNKMISWSFTFSPVHKGYALYY